jgi:hypothetical protein
MLEVWTSVLADVTPPNRLIGAGESSAAVRKRLCHGQDRIGFAPPPVFGRVFRISCRQPDENVPVKGEMIPVTYDRLRTSEELGKTCSDRN